MKHKKDAPVIMDEKSKNKSMFGIGAVFGYGTIAQNPTNIENRIPDIIEYSVDL